MKIIIICNDESYFYLTIPVKNQNNGLWSESQPSIGKETI